LIWWLEDNMLVALAVVFVAGIVLLVRPPIQLPAVDVAPTVSPLSRLYYDEKPIVVDWMIGNALGSPVFAKAAVLELEMTVYPPTDATSIYPANVPLSPEVDPRSGYYAVGFEGSLQANIWFDPVSGKFYDRFLDAPASARDVMAYTPPPGDAGGIVVVQGLIAEALRREAEAKAANEAANATSVSPQPGS